MTSRSDLRMLLVTISIYCSQTLKGHVSAYGFCIYFLQGAWISISVLEVKGGVRECWKQVFIPFDVMRWVE